MKSCRENPVWPVTQLAVDSARFREGIKLFNNAEFFEAHEVLEDVWRAAPTADKKFLQGLIQAAVAFHHHSTGNAVGARSLLARAQRNLSGYPREFRGIPLERLLESLGRWQAALEDGQPVPPLPRI
jgi:predicted metal-dependent hydrolase